MKKIFILLLFLTLASAQDFQKTSNFPDFEEYLLSKKTEKFHDKREEESNNDFYLVYVGEAEAGDSKAKIALEGNAKNIDVTGFIRYRYENHKRRNLAESLLFKRKKN